MTDYSDAAKRLADAYNLHRVADPYNSVGQWFAVRLNDGTGDGELYPSKKLAVHHQHHDEDFYAFVQIVPTTMTPHMAETLLAVQRRMYNGGFKLADRDSESGGFEMIRRTSSEDQYNQIRALFVGDRAPSNISYRK